MAQDAFTLMRSTFTLQRVLLNERALSGEENLPPLLTAREVLEFATIEGARCAHLDRKIGTLTPGKEADVVLLRTDRLNVWPLNNAAGRRGDADGLEQRRRRLHRRRGAEVAGQPGRRGRAAGHPPGPGVARRGNAPRRLPDEPRRLSGTIVSSVTSAIQPWGAKLA